MRSCLGKLPCHAGGSLQTFNILGSHINFGGCCDKEFIVVLKETPFMIPDSQHWVFIRCRVKPWSNLVEARLRTVFYRSSPLFHICPFLQPASGGPRGTCAVPLPLHIQMSRHRRTTYPLCPRAGGVYRALLCCWLYRPVYARGFSLIGSQLHGIGARHIQTTPAYPANSCNTPGLWVAFTSGVASSQRVSCEGERRGVAEVET